jgi:hypothetical protein
MGGCCTMLCGTEAISIDQVEAAKNIWTSEKTRRITDNYNKMMNRTWYLIANTMPKGHGACPEGMSYFTESYRWQPGSEGVHGFNHTVEKKFSKNKPQDFGDWHVYTESGEFIVQLKLFYNMWNAVKIKWNFLNFPENDRTDQFWTAHFRLDTMDYDVFWLFALTPHISDELYNAELERLKTEHQVDLEKFIFYRTQTPEDYEIGTYDEEFPLYTLEENVRNLIKAPSYRPGRRMLEI